MPENDKLKFSQLAEITRAQMAGSDYTVGYKANGDNKKWTLENQADFLLNDSDAGQELQKTFVADLSVVTSGEKTFTNIVQGSYTAQGTIDSTRTNRVAIYEMFHVYKGDIISFKSVSGGYIGQFNVGYFNVQTKEYITESSWLDSGDLVFDNEYYIRVAFRNVNNTSITPSNYDAITKLVSPVVNVNQLKNTVNIIPNDNLITDDLNNGYWMDLDGVTKASSSWGMTDYVPVIPNTTYNLYSFMRKNKECGNVYVVYFDVLKRFVSSESLQSATEFTTPSDCVYIVFSGAKAEMKYLYLTNSTTPPTVYKKHGQDTYFNVKSLYNRSSWGDTINWAKMGINLSGDISGQPIYPHGSKYSFLAAMYEGFDTILIDIIYTSDGHYVVSHDDNLYPYAKTANGTALSNPWNIREHTLAEVEALDMGYDYGSMYQGTKILTFEEALSFIKNIGMNLVVEMEYANGLDEFKSVCETIKKYGFRGNAGIFSYYPSELATVEDIIPEASLFLYVSGTETEIDNLITNAIALKTDKNKVIINHFAQLPSSLTQTQIQRIIDNDLYYSASTPSSEPTGFLQFMNTAPLTSYITHFGTLTTPAYKMLMDDALQ